MKTKNIISLVVAVAVVVLSYFAFHTAPAPVSDQPVGLSQTNIGEFPEGVKAGDDVTFDKVLSIPVGSNQAAWTNHTGRIVYVESPTIQIGYTSGTASTSLTAYVATSTGTTFSDYSSPALSYMPISGVTWATSTTATGAPVTASATTSAAGIGSVAIPDGSSLIVDIQQTYKCKSNGLCETATSTNRGIGSFFFDFTGQYQP